MSTAFVLGGGGAAGAVQVGMLKKLAYSGVFPDKIYGTSAGALNAFGYSCGGIERLEKMWTDINKMSHVFDYNFGAILFGRTGLMNANPLKKRLEKIHNTPLTPFEVCAVDLRDGTKHYFSDKNPEILKYTVASASIPGLVSPVVEGQSCFVDGGTMENVPLKKAIDDGHDTIYVLLCQPFVRKLALSSHQNNIVRVLFRSFEAMRHEMLMDDILTCLWCNLLEKKGMGEYKKINLKIMSPKFTVLDVMDFNRNKIKQGISHGWSIEPEEMDYEKI